MSKTQVNIEQIILSNLITNEKFTGHVYPFIKEEYFLDVKELRVFKYFSTFFDEYRALPDKQVLYIQAQNDETLNETILAQVIEYLDKITHPDYLKEKKDLDWLVNTTEKWCQDQAFVLALQQATGGITDASLRIASQTIMRDALAVSFQQNLGHDWVDDAELRYDANTKVENKIPFDIEQFNKITNNGFNKKTLNIFIAQTHAGKSLFMCHMATHNLTMGYNVLYLSFELSDLQIGERIDANILDTDMRNLYKGGKNSYLRKIEQAKQKKLGKLYIQSWASGTSNINKIRHFIEELKLKRSFVPDIIYVDYLNIIEPRSKMPIYEQISKLAVELRALAFDYDLPVVTVTQVNRSGYGSADVGMDSVSQSYDVASHADFMCALIRTDALKELDQVLVKQLKNRYANMDTYGKFVVGLDVQKMRIYEVSQDFVTATKDKDDEDDASGLENSAFERGLKAERDNHSKFSKYKGVKI